MRRCAVCILFAGMAFAQLDSNSVTVNTSRSTLGPIDQVTFAVSVNSDFTKSLTDIVNALSPAGITPSDLTYLAPSFTPTQPLEWRFNFSVPLTSLKATVATLSTLQQSIPANNPGLTLSSFSVVSSQSSQTTPCPVTGLLSDAATQAQSLAAGAGRSLGGLLAMSSYTSTCSLTVKYALGN